MNRSLSFRRVLPFLLGGLAVCLLAVSAAAGMLACLYGHRQLALLDGFCTALVTRAPETADAVYALAKEGGFTLSQVPGVLAERDTAPPILPPAPEYCTLPRQPGWHWGFLCWQVPCYICTTEPTGSSNP